MVRGKEGDGNNAQSKIHRSCSQEFDHEGIHKGKDQGWTTANRREEGMYLRGGQSDHRGGNTSKIELSPDRLTPGNWCQGEREGERKNACWDFLGSLGAGISKGAAV